VVVCGAVVVCGDVGAALGSGAGGAAGADNGAAEGAPANTCSSWMSRGQGVSNRCSDVNDDAAFAGKGVGPPCWCSPNPVVAKAAAVAESWSRQWESKRCNKARRVAL